MPEGFTDPGEPGELTGRMRAKDLVNKPLLIRPNKIAQGMGKDDNGNPKPYDYFDCDIWVLDRAGIVEQGSNVQVSWMRVMPQLAEKIGQFVAATPIRQDDNSIVLQPFSEKGKEVARLAMKEIEAIPEEQAPPDDEYSPDPF